MSEKNFQGPVLPYSYHTFLFPFLWNINGDTQYADFEQILAVGKRWEEEKWDNAVDCNPADSGLSIDEWRLRYAAYQYFTPAARDILFNVGSKNNVRLYKWIHAPKTGDMQYVIEKGSQKYVLKLTSIRLKVYDTGVAVVVIQGENHDQPSMDAVNAINEYGRRINMPFLPVDSNVLCADRISILVNGNTVCDDYVAFLKALSCAPKQQNVSWNYIMKPIQYLIDGDGTDNGGIRVTTNIVKADRDFMIRPCIDDRMFVCCLVRDDAFCGKVSGYDAQQHAYHYLTGCDSSDASVRALSDELYKLIFVENSLTCQSVVMKRRLLQAAVYDRWIDYGTVYGVSQHSFICVTGEDPGLLATPINPFLTQMVEMATLAIVQRSYQLLLFNRISDISEKFNQSTQIDDAQFQQIESLQAMYVKCQNQILLPQVTAQEQGIELYAMLQDRLLITENKLVMDEQINNLRDVSTISHERLIRNNDQELVEQEARSQWAFNLLAVIFSVFSILEPLEGNIGDELWYNAWVWFGIKCVIFVGFCIFLAVFRKPKRKKKK